MKTLFFSLFLLSFSLVANAQAIYIGDDFGCASTSARASRKLLIDCTETSQVLRVHLTNLDGQVVATYPVNAVVSPQTGAVEIQLQGAELGLYSCKIEADAQTYDNLVLIE